MDPRTLVRDAGLQGRAATEKRGNRPRAITVAPTIAAKTA
jgi:hypothetical protein